MDPGSQRAPSRLSLRRRDNTSRRRIAMRVTVLLFAAHRELVGRADTVVALPEGATVETLLSELKARGGGWALLPARAAVAVNRKYAGGDTTLADGDEVALIPPVAGG